MITWGDIRDSLYMVDKGRLSDPAIMMVDNELVPFDVLESEIPEIGDKRLVAVPQSEIVKDKDEQA